MENAQIHEIELYPPETFRTLLEHEVNRSHRYGDSLSLIDLAVETDPNNAHALHSAEVFAINVLNLHSPAPTNRGGVRNTDIPCKKGSEFLVLMPASGIQGARTACERLSKLMNVEPQSFDKVSFKMFAFIGLAALPYDRSVSSDGLLQHAAQALQHARTNRLKSVVSFSEIKE